jgi:hypothetical protein
MKREWGASVNLADKIVMRPVASLVPYASNASTHTADQISHARLPDREKHRGLRLHEPDPRRRRERDHSRSRSFAGCGRITILSANFTDAPRSLFYMVK